MKILVCVSEYPPINSSGKGNVAYNLVERLKKKADCKVCSPTGPDIVLGSTNLIQKTGIIGILYFWFKVSFFLKTADFDIIWLHDPLPVFKLSSKSIVSTFHFTYLGFARNMRHVVSWFLNFYFNIAAVIEKFCLKKLVNSPFIGVSIQMTNELKEICPGKKDIFTVLNGVDTKRFIPSLNRESGIKKELGIEKNPVILFVGRLEQNKSVDLVIKSLPYTLQKFPKVKLLIVGDGTEKNNLIALSKKLDVAEAIIFCGNKSQEILPQFYSASDVVVCPWSGLVLFEAMAAGRPIVATNIEWHAEVITHMQNGILVEHLNIEELAKGVNLLLSDPALSNNLGKKAREFAVNNLDWEAIADQYFDIFLNLDNANYISNKYLK